MIWNIIDRRSRHRRWKLVNAVIEAVEHDDSCADADKVPDASPMEVIDYDQREGVSVAEALGWANAQRCAVTLYLYDNGKATTNNEGQRSRKSALIGRRQWQVVKADRSRRRHG